MTAKSKKSFFETRLMGSRIKSRTVSLFPEAGLGYLLGPILALFCNGVVNVWLIQYWHNVIGMGSWGQWLETAIPLVSSVIIIVGNILVGRLMERKPSLAGKARPLILLGMPAIAVALVLLFVFPVPGAANEQTILSGNASMEGGLVASICAFIGYNLFYAFAWPMYYTSHSALVNLSTRDGSKRGLLGTAVMAAQLAAAGISGIFGGVIIDNVGLLPVYTYDNHYAYANKLLSDADMKAVEAGKKVLDKALEHGDVKVVTSAFTNDFNQVKDLAPGTWEQTISREAANQKWFILMIIMIVALVIGCLLEYFFATLTFGIFNCFFGDTFTCEEVF